jgi:hypothetical protein
MCIESYRALRFAGECDIFRKLIIIDDDSAHVSDDTRGSIQDFLGTQKSFLRIVNRDPKLRTGIKDGNEDGCSSRAFRDFSKDVSRFLKLASSKCSLMRDLCDKAYDSLTSILAFTQ